MSKSPAKSQQADAVQRELASRLLARRRLLAFIQRMNPMYLAGWVHEDICRRLERFSDDVAAKKSPRLMLLMPPRHGKSEIASRSFPPWHLGRFPDHEVIACSYNLSLAMSFSRKVKAIVEDPNYQSVFDMRLDPNNQSTEEWGIAGHRGSYVAAGVGGGITGKGAHVLLIDDPIKNAEEADSQQVRESIWDWYGSTAYTRLAPGAGVLIIQTWWHDDDLAGKIQNLMKEDPEADQFEIVKYPAVAENDEYLDHDTDLIVYNEPPVNGRKLRSKGEALHPDRYDILKLNRIKKTIQPRFWSALYQQNPVPDDGNYFTRSQFRRSTAPDPTRSHVYQAWDFAISEKQQNDYTVGSCGVQDEDDVLHIPEVIRFKSGDSLFIVNSMINFAKRWYHKNLIVGVEDGQIWRAISALLYKRMREERLYFSIEVLKPLTDKMVRARPLQGRMQQGMVRFEENAEWFPVVQNELLRFPAGVNDDCVDSLAWLAHLVVGKEPPAKPRVKPVKGWKDKLRVSHESRTHMAA